MHKRKMNPPETTGEVANLGDFAVYRQETDHTCGPCAVRMILKYLGSDVPENKIAEASFTHPMGTLHWTLLSGFRKFAKPLGYNVVMRQNLPDMYYRIKNELKNGRPVMFIYCVIDEFHPPRKVTHYGVLTALDEPSGFVKVANPFGRIEEMPIDEWWRRFSLEDEFLPVVEGFFLKTGILGRGTAFFLEPQAK